MIQFIAGFISGVIAGTKYDCKPYLELVVQFIKENMPKER